MAHHNEIPIGVFYRDVYWKFAGFRQQIGIAKHITSIPFYIEELRLYRNTATNIFVPSGEFSALLPDSLRFRCHPMPPGLLIHKIGKRCTDERLRLFYVGNIKPPFYDLSPAIDAMRQLSDLPIRLTVCTRRTEVEAYASHYRWPPNTTIVHLIGKDLNEVLRESDIFLMCFKPDSYRKIAMPLKLFEAIAFGLPVIATGPTAVSQFVKMEQTGWEIEPSGLTELLRHILANREEIESYRKRILAFRKLHSWKARALQVCKILNRDKM
jgi:glycosyltransferase involved in cell wall biosynthesis